MLLYGGIRVRPITASMKQKAAGRKIIIWEEPFKFGFGSATDEVISEDPEKVAFSQQLTKEELDIIRCAVGSYECRDIKSFLIQNCNVRDPTPLSWEDIIAHCKQYLRRQRDRVKADLAGKKPVHRKHKTKKKRGRPPKYTPKKIQAIKEKHDHYAKSMDDKAAWHKAAEDEGIKSGKAAEMACRRYLHKQNK